jgi:hypothetical protein
MYSPRMGLSDTILDKGGGVVGELGKKYGIDAGQVKGALDKIVPFLKEKLAGGLSLPGRGTALLGSIKQHDLKGFVSDPSRLGGTDAEQHGNELLDAMDADEKEAHVQDVARATGLPVGQVRSLLPAAAVATAGAMDADGVIDQILGGQQELLARLAQIKADADK